MKVKDIVLISLLSASITSGKLVLSLVPNVEIVTLLFILYTIVFGIKNTLFVSIIFSTTEVFIYGLNIWSIFYFIVWPLLIIATHFINKKFNSEYTFAVLALIFGLSFGFLAAVIESLFFGLSFGIAYFLRGIVFDIVHGVSNFIVVLLLFNPLKKLLLYLKNDYYN